MKLYITRHGETAKEDGVIQRHDNPLTKKGRKQAKALVKQIPDVNLFYSSSTLRASDTAKIINKRLKKEIIFDPRLGDLGGKYEGMTYKENRELIEKGEIENPFIKLFEDTKSFLNDIEEKPQDSALIVSHSQTIKMIQYALIENEFDMNKFKQIPGADNCELITVDTKGTVCDDINDNNESNKNNTNKLTFKGVKSKLKNLLSGNGNEIEK